MKAAKDRNASAVSPPFPRKAANVCNALAVSREKVERSMDKPVEGCDASMGVLLMLWLGTNIMPHLAAWSIPFFVLRPRCRDKIRARNGDLSRNC